MKKDVSSEEFSRRNVLYLAFIFFSELCQLHSPIWIRCNSPAYADKVSLFLFYQGIGIPHGFDAPCEKYGDTDILFHSL